jgi:protein TonB
VEQAQLLAAPEPVLPVLAKQQKVSGTVSLEATIDTGGRLKAVHVVKGHPLLTRAAVDAVLKWRYRPATLNGETIETKVAIEVIFHPSRD